MAQSVDPRRNREKPGVSSGHRSRLNDEDSVRAPHQGQQSTRTAPTGRTHDCKRPLRCTPNDLLPGGGHPHMRRREFITLCGGAVVAWPLAARAQQPAMPVVGFIFAGPADASRHYAAAFRKGLSDTGNVEGQNVVVEYHWLEGQYDRARTLVADMARRRVAVIASLGGTPVALAAKAATASIPIVFSVPDDPVQLGLVASLARPGGNMTGVNFFMQEITAKRLGLLHELVPKAARIAVLVNPTNPASAERTLKEVQAAAPVLGLQIHVFNASTSNEID